MSFVSCPECGWEWDEPELLDSLSIPEAALDLLAQLSDEIRRGLKPNSTVDALVKELESLKR